MDGEGEEATGVGRGCIKQVRGWGLRLYSRCLGKPFKEPKQKSGMKNELITQALVRDCPSCKSSRDRNNGISGRGSQGRLPGRRMPLVSLLSEVSCPSFIDVCQSGSSEKRPHHLTYLHMQVQGTCGSQLISNDCGRRKLIQAVRLQG